MKKVLALLVFTHTLVFLFSQPAIEWKKAYGGSSGDFFNEVKPTSDGGFIAIGYTRSNNGNATGNHGDSDFWVLKLSAEGEIEWTKSLGGSESDAGYFIEETKDGGYILAGVTDSNDGQVTGYHGNTDAWLVKLSPSGELEWQRAYGGSNADEGRCIRETEHNTYLFLAYTRSLDGDITTNLHGEGDIWFMELSLTGDILWQKTYGGSKNDYGITFSDVEDGGYILSGHTLSSDGDVPGSHGQIDIWLLKLDKSREIQWSKTYGGSDFDGIELGASNIQILSDGSYIITASTYSSDGMVEGSHGKSDIWLFRVSDTGVLLWQKTFGGSGYDQPSTIQLTADGGLVLVGATESTDGDPTGFQGEYDWWLVKLDSLFDLQWQRTLGGDKLDFGFSILQTIDGGYMVCGNAESKNGDMTGFSHPSHEGWIFKFAPELVGTNEALAGAQLTILPNPANSTIQFELPEGEWIMSVSIMNMLGQNIREQSLQANQGIDISLLPNGTYLLQVKTNSGKRYYGKFQKTP